jgi:tetratricopeptide (TPR) repeat protein
MSLLGRSSGLCSLLVLPLLAWVQSNYAQTRNPTLSAANVATPFQEATISPELQGDVLMARGRYEAAIDAYQRETNQSAVLLNKIGIAYHHMFAFEVARKYYEQALAIDPHYPEALNNLGAVYYSDHDFGKAERNYKEALKFEPKAAIFARNLGTAYFAHGKDKLGMEAYRKALALDPHILDLDQGQTVDEGSSLRQVVASNYYLARICAASGKMHEAIAYLRMALEAGFHDRKQLMKDEEFTALRSTPEFHQLLTDLNVDK